MTTRLTTAVLDALATEMTRNQDPGMAALAIVDKVETALRELDLVDDHMFFQSISKPKMQAAISAALETRRTAG